MLHFRLTQEMILGLIEGRGLCLWMEVGPTARESSTEQVVGRPLSFADAVSMRARQESFSSSECWNWGCGVCVRDSFEFARFGDFVGRVP